MLRKIIVIALLIAGPVVTIRQSLIVLPILAENATRWDADPRTSILWYYAKLERPQADWISTGIDEWEAVRAR